MSTEKYRVVGRTPTQTSGQQEATDWTVFNGTNITATFNEVVQVTLEGLTYAVRRDIAPVYVLGDANPKAFSKGRRAITGSMVFQVFDRDELLYSFFPHTYGKYNQDGWLGHSNEWSPWDLAVDEADKATNSTPGIWLADLRRGEKVGVTKAGDLTDIVAIGNVGEGVQNLWQARAPHFLDELPPFDVTLTFVNEVGQAAQMRLLSVVLVNEGHGYSMGTQVVEKSVTFFAQDMIPLHPITSPTG